LAGHGTWAAAPAREGYSRVYASENAGRDVRVLVTEKVSLTGERKDQFFGKINL
jgi:hypothetical protein